MLCGRTCAGESLQEVVEARQPEVIEWATWKPGPDKEKRREDAGHGPSLLLAEIRHEGQANDAPAMPASGIEIP